MRSAVKLALAAAVPLLLAAPAEAKVYELAKFKILSVSGSRAITFTEDGVNSSGSRCTGTTSARLDFRSTRPLTVYMNVRRIHGRRKVVVSDRAKPPQPQTQQMDGVATISRTADYQSTAGCRDAPLACTETEVPTDLNLFGTDDRSAGVAANPLGFEFGSSCWVPFRPLGSSSWFEQTAYADVFSWSELFDGKGKRLEDTNRIEETLTLEPPSDESAPPYPVSGVRTDETSFVMKRLKLEEDLQRGR